MNITPDIALDDLSQSLLAAFSRACQKNSDYARTCDNNNDGTEKNLAVASNRASVGSLALSLLELGALPATAQASVAQILDQALNRERGYYNVYDSYYASAEGHLCTAANRHAIGLLAQALIRLEVTFHARAVREVYQRVVELDQRYTGHYDNFSDSAGRHLAVAKNREALGSLAPAMTGIVKQLNGVV